jgi:hypothetical protein
LLLTIFVIVELARLLHAWMAIENGARFGVRYAVTGEYDVDYCRALPQVCGIQPEEDLARIISIKDAANAGAVAILKDSTVPTVGEPGFFKITVCSNNVVVDQYVDSDPNVPKAASCDPSEHPGGPGDRISVTIDFNHPIISPFISSVWPDLHLTAKREGIVEQYRTARVVGLPATISGPSPTPSETPTPTNTPSPLPPTNTPTPTPTPDCSDLRITSMRIRGDDVQAFVRNNNVATAYLIDSHLEWDELTSDMEVDRFEFNGQRYYDGNDDSSPTDSTAPSIPLVGRGNTDRWAADFRDEPYEPIWGDYAVELTFDFPNWGTCVVSESLTAPQLPSPTPRPTRIPRPTNTPGPPPTPKPKNTQAPPDSDPPKEDPPDSDPPKEDPPDSDPPEPPATKIPNPEF